MIPAEPKTSLKWVNTGTADILRGEYVCEWSTFCIRHVSHLETPFVIQYATAPSSCNSFITPLRLKLASSSLRTERLGWTCEINTSYNFHHFHHTWWQLNAIIRGSYGFPVVQWYHSGNWMGFNDHRILLDSVHILEWDLSCYTVVAKWTQRHFVIKTHKKFPYHDVNIYFNEQLTVRGFIPQYA